MCSVHDKHLYTCIVSRDARRAVSSIIDEKAFEADYLSSLTLHTPAARPELGRLVRACFGARGQKSPKRVLAEALYNSPVATPLLFPFSPLMVGL
jgi:hypothetical protein